MSTIAHRDPKPANSRRATDAAALFLGTLPARLNPEEYEDAVANATRDAASYGWPDKVLADVRIALANRLGLRSVTAPPARSEATLRNAVEVRAAGWSWRLEDHGRHGKAWYRFNTVWEPLDVGRVPVSVQAQLQALLGAMTTVRA